MDSPALAMGSMRVGHLSFLFLFLLWGSWGLVLLVGFSSELRSVTEGWMGHLVWVRVGSGRDQWKSWGGVEVLVGGRLVAHRICQRVLSMVP